MNILLFGKTGQVGWELQRALAPLGNLIALDVHSTDYCGDFSNPEGVAETVRSIRPDIIVNAAAHTAVDKAESEPKFAQLLNATSVEAIAKAANEVGAWVIHYSTDYVFPGTGEIPWQEEDATAPLNVYGETKLAGEKALQEHCAKHLIFRTSWVYAGKGNNFAKTMLRLAKEREELAVINDQFGAPTGAELLADCTAHAIRVALNKPEVAGLYHLVASGTTTWHDYAALVFEEARKAGIPLALNKLNAVPTTAYPTPARRPHNSRLNTEKFQQNFALVLPDWQVGVKRMLNELLNISPIYYADSIKSLVLLSSLIPVFLVTQILLAELEGREYFGILNIQKSVGNSLIAGLPALFVLINQTLFSAIIGVAIARVICLWLSYIMSRERITIDISFFSITVLKRLFRYGGWVTISNIISPILASMDRFILSHIQGASKISFYTVPNELVTRLGIVPGSLGKAVFPKLSHARNFTASYAEQKKAYILMTVIVMPLVLFVYYYAKFILTLWMGAEYAGISVEILRIMLIGYIFNCYSQISFANIQAFGKAKYTAYIHMMEFIPYLIMLYIISKEYGVIGVAWLWTIRVIIDFLMLLYMSYRCNNLMKKG